MAQRVKRLPGDGGSIPGSGRSPGEGNGTPCIYIQINFCIGNQKVGKTPLSTIILIEEFTSRLVDFSYFDFFQ